MVSGIFSFVSLATIFITASLYETAVHRGVQEKQSLKCSIPLRDVGLPICYGY